MKIAILTDSSFDGDLKVLRTCTVPLYCWRRWYDTFWWWWQVRWWLFMIY
nr:hypothetical protein [Entomoplasma sp. MP1]